MQPSEFRYRQGVEFADIERIAQKLLLHYSRCDVPDRGLRARLAVGRTLLLAGDPGAAATLFRRALDDTAPIDNPEHYTILANLGYALTDLGAYEEAIGYLTRAWNAQHLAWIAIALAYAHRLRNHPDDANATASWLERAREVDPKNYQNEEDLAFWRRIYPEIADQL